MLYRRLEARGELRGGRFVAGVTGEQFALPEAVTVLRAVRRQAARGSLVALSAADPLNLTGTVLPGQRVPALARNRIVFRDGIPVAVLEGGESRLLEELAADEVLVALGLLQRRPVSPKLRMYLGMNGRSASLDPPRRRRDRRPVVAAPDERG
jgi:ATP-dependent Lhr-like helicase